MSEETEDILIKTLMGEDELGAIVRSHILIENLILRLLELLIPYQEHLEKIRLGYRHKVDLVLAMGLKPQYGPPLLQFGKIRNDFAHKPDIKLTSKHVNDLYGAMHAEDRKVVLIGFENTKRQISGSTSKAFKKLDPIDRFILIVVSLRAVLLAAIIEIENEINKTT